VKFVQIIEFKTSKIDEIRALQAQYRAATEGKRTSSRATVCADRDNPGTYVVVIEFPSYEDAQRNNELPETQKFSAEQMKLADGPATFRNLDLLEEES
jgi:quinol monooxygenase YgiN